MEMQKKEELLIVDDSKFQRVVLRAMLSEHFEIIEATDGVNDMIFAPVDAGMLKRRIQEYIKIEEQQKLDR